MNIDGWASGAWTPSDKSCEALWTISQTINPGYGCLINLCPIYVLPASGHMPDPQRGSQTYTCKRGTRFHCHPSGCREDPYTSRRDSPNSITAKTLYYVKVEYFQGKTSGSFRSLPDSLTGVEETREITSSPHFWLAFVPPATPLLYRYIAVLLSHIILSRINYRITQRRTGRGSKGCWIYPDTHCTGEETICGNAAVRLRPF